MSTLRYYDRIGLLVPAATDPVSGYRYYTAEQLIRAALVERLRAAGVPPDAIRRIVAGGPDAAAVIGDEVHRVRAELDRGRRALELLDGLADGIDDDPGISHLNGTATTIHLPPRWVATRSFHLPARQLPLHELGHPLTHELTKLRATLRRCSLTRSGPYGACFPVDPTDPVDGYVFAPLATAASDPALEMIQLPATPAIRVEHRGSPHTIPVTYHAIFAAAQTTGRAPTGPLIEEFPTFDNPQDGAPSLVLTLPYRDPTAPSRHGTARDLQGRR